jgi:hypothetical protein
MDRREYVHKRKGRYRAQLLEEFERDIEPRLPEEVAQKFKALVRRKVTALAVDCIEVMDLENTVMNGAARDLKDRIHPDAGLSSSHDGRSSTPARR